MGLARELSYDRAKLLSLEVGHRKVHRSWTQGRHRCDAQDKTRKKVGLAIVPPKDYLFPAEKQVFRNRLSELRFTHFTEPNFSVK